MVSCGEDSLFKELRATKSIKIGDEVTASYLGAFNSVIPKTAARREMLATWNFTCCCAKCEKGKYKES